MKHRLPPSPDEYLASAEVLGLRLSDEQARSLSLYERLLADRAIPLGLVASSDRARLRPRHLIDSLRAAAEVGDAETAYDLGSGAGLPGIVVAIAIPQLELGLVEIRQRRVAFLEFAVAELALPNVRVLARRVEDLTEPVDVCFARAFASAGTAWEAAEPRLRVGGRLVYFAGGEWSSSSVPSTARLQAVRPPVLESAGPLVIMTRQ